MADENMSDSSMLNGPIANIEELNSSCQDVEQLKELDNLLKCKICYEYFNTCVVTDCSHNFCSLCIRKYIQFRTECPICFKELYDSQLRANRIMDNLVEMFPPLKDRLIRYVRTIKTLKPNCIYVSPLKNPHHNPKTPNKCPKSLNKISEISAADTEDSASQLFEPSPAAATNSKQNTPNVVNNSCQNKVIIPRIFQSPGKKNSPVLINSIKTVDCPVCSVAIPERNINLHLDACLNPDKNAAKKKNSSPIKRAHLPKLVLGLMSTTALKSKAKEYGLNAQGDNETLKNRIRRYTVLYNAECDKMNPRPAHEIIRQLEKEEKILASQKFPKSIFTTHTENAASKEELSAQYLKENKKNFNELIEKVKQRQREVKSDDETKTSQSEKHSMCDYSEPSTSKFRSPENFCFDNDDMIEIDELKLEKIKDEPDSFNTVKKENISSKNYTTSSGNSTIADEEKDYVTSVLKKRRLRNKRLNFDDCTSEDSNSLNTTTVGNASSTIHEPDIEIYEVLTDVDEEEKPNIGDIDEINDLSNSPVLQKRKPSRRKRQDDDPPAKKSLRKRKR